MCTPVPPHIAARTDRPRPVVAPVTATTYDGTVTSAWVTAGGGLTLHTVTPDGTEAVADFTEAQAEALLAGVAARRAAAA